VADYLNIDELAQLLSLEPADAYLLIRTGEIPGIKLAGRGQWRVLRRDALEYQCRA
jgi:hypothetical protein